METRKLLIATRNRGKARELVEILKGLPFEVITLEAFPNAPEVIEDGHTFMENAMKKSRTLSLYTGLLTLGEDSGLEVDALGASPGIFSARYAHGEGSTDDENIEKLLHEMKDLPSQQRTARFVCHAALCEGEREVGTAYGEVRGVIAQSKQGCEGFGYDPVFIVPEYGKTFGQLPASIKNTISHRAEALRGIRKILKNLRG